MATIITYPKRPRAPSIKSYDDVKRLAPKMGLTDTTMALLNERGYCSVQSLRDMNEADLELLPLYAGQQLAVSKLVTHLNEVLKGFEINDGDKTGENAGPIGSITEKMAPPSIKETENTNEDNHYDVREKINKCGILAEYSYPEGETAGNRKVPRPHEFLVGKMTGKELTQDEFLYGNLLILEYMIEQGSTEVRAHVKHMRFMVLKLIHGYPLDQVVYYDYALRNKMEKEKIFMPLEADSALLDKYVKLHKHSEERDKDEKKSKSKKVNKKTNKGKKKAKIPEEDDFLS